MLCGGGDCSALSAALALSPGVPLSEARAFFVVVQGRTPARLMGDPLSCPATARATN